MPAAHGVDLPAWWQADPSGDRELDLTQFYEITGRCAAIILPRLDDAMVIRVRPETVFRMNPITELDRVCQVVLSVSLPEPVVFFAYQEAPGTGVPSPRLCRSTHPRVMVAALGSKLAEGPLSLMPIFVWADIEHVVRTFSCRWSRLGR